MYGCEIWSFTLRKERRLRVSQNYVLRTIYGPKADEVTGEWIKLHNEKYNSLYSSTNIVRVIKSRRIRWSRHVARMGGREACTGFWWGNLRERQRLGDSGVDGRIILSWIFRKWDMNWFGLSQDRDRWRALANAVLKLRVPQNATNFLASWEPVSFSRRTVLYGVCSV